MKLLHGYLVLTAAAFAVTQIPGAKADTESCSEAADHYKSAAEDALSASRRYANCVAGSRGRDDCSSEFHRVRNAQDDFESAIAKIKNECE